MAFYNSLLEIAGFGIGFPIGILVGYILFIYFEPTTVQDPIIRPVHELDSDSLVHLLSKIPLWVKQPDYERMDWLNDFVYLMWPYLDKGICSMIRKNLKPIFQEYTGQYFVNSIEFKRMSLGTFPPIVHGIKVCETNENELILEPAIRWAGNPDIVLMLKFLCIPITVQLVDLQICAMPRIVLKPLVPTFPCFSSIAVSLLEKPFIDFGLKLVGGDLMAIPGLYQFVQVTIKKQIAILYLWPQTLDVPVLDSAVGAVKKPVGILHVKVVRAHKLLKMDLFGASDPYVELSLTGENLPPQKTSIKMKTLNPEWNEDFRLTVKDPQNQVLQLHCYDWDEVGTHDKLGIQAVPLRSLTPNETKEMTLDLVKNWNPNDPQNKKHRGQLVLELKFSNFKDDTKNFNDCSDKFTRLESCVGRSMENVSLGAGLLLVTIIQAENVEGKIHTNPYASVLFRGEEKKTMTIKKCRNPCWEEEFEFVLEDAPLKEKINIEVMSKRRGFFRRKESLGYVDINLYDVVTNGRIKEKYHLINSKHGIIHVEMVWNSI